MCIFNCSFSFFCKWKEYYSLSQKLSCSIVAPLQKINKYKTESNLGPLSLIKWPHRTPGSPLESAQCCVLGSSFEQLAALMEHGVHKGPGSKDNHHKLFTRNVAPKCPFATLIFEWSYKPVKWPSGCFSLRRKLIFTFILFRELWGVFLHFQRLGKVLHWAIVRSSSPKFHSLHNNHVPSTSATKGMLAPGP